MNSNALVKFLKRVTCISDNESRKKTKLKEKYYKESKSIYNELTNGDHGTSNWI